MLENIKSRIIINKIFEYLIKIIKLKLLKHNKSIKGKINIELKDYIYFKLLKDFNNKYDSNIDNTDIGELNLEYKTIRNSGLRYLAQISFNNLKQIIFSENEISNIGTILPTNFNFANLPVKKDF